MKIRNRLVIVWLLTGLNLFNYVDRYVVNAVNPRIQDAFTLSDARAGWVVSAFMLGYFVTSPLFGALGDRWARRGLIALGVFVWSLATAASGFAAGFLSLIAARIFVGVGEASYATLSPTIIDDLSGPAQKNRFLAIFYAAIPVGSALGYVLGGQIEHMFGWRAAFYVAGAPGLALAVLCLLIDEPARTSTASAHHASFLSSVGKLLAIPMYRFAVLGYIAYTFALGAFAAWAPKYLDSRLGLPLHVADHWLGVILALTGFAGTALGGWLGDRWRGGGGDRTRASLQVCAIFTALAAPFALLTLLAGSPTLFFASIGVTEFFLFVSTAPVNAALLGSVPASLRASGMAMSIFAIHLFGDLISPPMVGSISDLVRGGADPHADAGHSLQTAMFLLPAMIALGAALWWLGSRGAGAPAPLVRAPETAAEGA